MTAASLETTREQLADEWRRRSPIGRDEIAAFYRESEMLGADLDAWHDTPERQVWTRAIVEIAAGNDVETVLDVGAGAGHDLRAVSHLSLSAVEPNSALRANLPGQTYADISVVNGTFDLVICIDVLEHVPDPEALLGKIIERVKFGGLLVEASATHDQETPLHLPELEGWVPDKFLQDNGFVAVQLIDRLAVWQKAEIKVKPATIICVAHREITVPTVQCLFELVGMGWPIALPYGDALIDRARAKAVSSWFINQDDDVFLMVDDDIVFKAEDAARVVELAREKRSIACAAYPVADGGHLASRAWPGERLDFGPDIPAREIRWPATGFMACHRDVIEALTKSMDVCYPTQPDKFWPMFQPYPFEGNYLSEDYAFGQRALELGFPTWLDPKTILFHLKVKGLSVLNMDGATVETRK
jgi:SAM-dependent methyltransferase